MLRHLWDDIRKGENIDLYLTIAAAVIFVVLNLVGVASTSFLAPLTLAVLGLLAITNLGNRHRMEELLAQKALTLKTAAIFTAPMATRMVPGKTIARRAFC